MQATAIAILILLALLLAVIIALEVRSQRVPAPTAPSDPLAEHIGRVVVVHRIAGSSIKGVLTELYPDRLVLRRCAHLGETGTELPFDGESWHDRKLTDFVQLLDA